jgi:hypothetical protein
MMPTKDLQKAIARRIVAERFRLFFAMLKEQLSHGADEIWRRVEGKIVAPHDKTAHAAKRSDQQE